MASSVVYQINIDLLYNWHYWWDEKTKNGEKSFLDSSFLSVFGHQNDNDNDFDGQQKAVFVA